MASLVLSYERMLFHKCSTFRVYESRAVISINGQDRAQHFEEKNIHRELKNQKLPFHREGICRVLACIACLHVNAVILYNLLFIKHMLYLDPKVTNTGVIKTSIPQKCYRFFKQPCRNAFQSIRSSCAKLGVLATHRFFFLAMARRKSGGGV